MNPSHSERLSCLVNEIRMLHAFPKHAQYAEFVRNVEAAKSADPLLYVEAAKVAARIEAEEDRRARQSVAKPEGAPMTPEERAEWDRWIAELEAKMRAQDGEPAPVSGSSGLGPITAEDFMRLKTAG